MRWTRWTALAVAVAFLSGCAYGYRVTVLKAGLSVSDRPDPAYYCYDCHGDRYFDPYYDYCTFYGFRFSWASYPRVKSLYRERYPRIKESHPDYGKYRYREGYRETPRYREPVDYDTWRRQHGPSDRGVERSGKKPKDREQGDDQQGKRKGKDRGQKQPDGSGSQGSLPEGAGL